MGKRKIQPQIPEIVLERLALYHCLLQEWIISRRTGSVTSKEISSILNLTDETVRRDLSFLDKSGGRPGVGYSIEELYKLLSDKLQMEPRVPVVVVGSVKTVEALLSIFNFEKFGFSPEGFFSENPNDEGRFFRGYTFYSIQNINGENIPDRARIALLATHPDWTQLAIDKLSEVGIKGILNLTPMIAAKYPDSVESIQLRYPCYLKVLLFKTGNKSVNSDS